MRMADLPDLPGIVTSSRLVGLAWLAGVAENG